MGQKCFLIPTFHTPEPSSLVYIRKLKLDTTEGMTGADTHNVRGQISVMQVCECIQLNRSM
jgi:hypothetical protein